MDDLQHECIICTLNLVVAPPSNHLACASELSPAVAVGELTAPQPHPGNNNEKTAVAVIKPCNHFLHDACLREWSQIANTCPFCRQTFNLVEVNDAVGGNFISSYTVQDKKQVAAYDSHIWLQEEEEEDAHPCPICNESNQPEVLLLCDACDANYHTHCVGLDDVPDGNWFCLECADTGAYCRAEEAAAAATRPEPISGRRAPRTQATVRRTRQRLRNEGWLGPWSQIGHRIHGATGLDIDFSEDEEANSWRRLSQDVVLQESQRSVWRVRLNIARRQGAAWAFRAPAPLILPRAPTPVESVEESMAWGDFEKAKEIDITSPRGRKRKPRIITNSATACSSGNSSGAPPERKLKRPRTRRVLDRPESSSSAAARPQCNEGLRQDSKSHIQTNYSDEPSFLSTLLKEVDMASGTDDARTIPTPSTISVPSRITSPSADSLSPITLPVSSNIALRAKSGTPPPHIKRRSLSPLPLTSRVEPIFPPVEYSTLRPQKGTTSKQTKSPITASQHSWSINNSSVHSHAFGRIPATSISPARVTMSIETKEDISKIVKSALSPHWKSAEITEEQYGDINRDVSRKLYEILADHNLADEREKHNCKKIALAEVETAVKSLTERDFHDCMAK
ncbi:hypothetical protein K3495_g10957 [Podosphaera aphanis]|nr:hypothetical protein K3495_g10957 [Podosphaera aphanis]